MNQKREHRPPRFTLKQEIEDDNMIGKFSLRIEMSECPSLITSRLSQVYLTYCVTHSDNLNSL